MLERIIRHTKNWFERDAARSWIRNVVFSTFTIEGGELAIADGFLQEGQYFRIVGSVFSDGLHQWPEYDLRDETFTGEVWALRIPNDFLALAKEIEQWQADYEAFCDKVANSDSLYKSESFGGYTYTKADVPSKDEQVGMWAKAFARQLARYAKV